MLLDGKDFFFQCSPGRFDGVCMSSWDWIYKIHKVYCQMNIPQRFHRNITRNLSNSNKDSRTPIIFKRNLFETFLVWIYPNVIVPAKGGLFLKSNAPNFAEFAYIIFKIKEYNGLCRLVYFYKISKFQRQHVFLWQKITLQLMPDSNIPLSKALIYISNNLVFFTYFLVNSID